MLPLRRAAAMLAALAALSACAPRITAHGTPMTRIEQAQITPGVDTRGSVLRQLGQPASTGLIDGERWYYVATVMERETYHARRIVDRQIIAVAFDDVGVVTAVQNLDMNDSMDVALRVETTPTYGRELTFAQQMFGNIGRGVPGLTQ